MRFLTTFTKLDYSRHVQIEKKSPRIRTPHLQTSQDISLSIAYQADCISLSIVRDVVLVCL